MNRVELQCSGKSHADLFVVLEDDKQRGVHVKLTINSESRKRKDRERERTCFFITVGLTSRQPAYVLFLNIHCCQSFFSLTHSLSRSRSAGLVKSFSSLSPFSLHPLHAWWNVIKMLRDSNPVKSDILCPSMRKTGLRLNGDGGR